MKINKKNYLLFLLCSWIQITYLIDNPHFYRANFFWSEPRFECPWLFSFDMNLAGGRAKTGRNSWGENTSILNIYGFQNMQALGKTPGLDPANPLDAILINLAALPENSSFSQLQFFGKFKTFEGTLNWYQNVCNGFFVQAYLPIRTLTINDTQRFTDQSPDFGSPNINSAEWTTFLSNFPAILSRFNLSNRPTHAAGIGDFTFLVGWARNNQDTEYLDFIDVSAKIGVLFPTGKKANEDEVFSIPLGYNGHFGVPLKFDLSLGYWEWLTVGMHMGALFLIEKSNEIRMKSNLNQSDYFMLLKGKAEIDPGTIWEISTYAKADHIYQGWSFLLGYTYTQKDEDCLEPKDTDLFPKSVVNSNARFQGWNMQVLHFNAEYDFAKKPTDVGLRLGLFYNYIVGGKRIFNTSMADGYFGLDLVWCF